MPLQLLQPTLTSKRVMQINVAFGQHHRGCLRSTSHDKPYYSLQQRLNLLSNHS